MPDLTILTADSLAAIGCFFAFVGIACAGWGLLAANRGLKRWRTLAERFPVRDRPGAEWRKLDWFKADNSCSFRGCGKVVADENYLWIMPPAIFSKLLPPVQLPWNETTDHSFTDRECSLKALDLKIRFAASAIPDNLKSRLRIRRH